MNEGKLINRLKKGDEKALEEIYTEYKSDFFAFAKRFKANNDDVYDSYQDATIILYEHALNGKIDDLKSSVKTYLFGIGKFVLIGKLKKGNKSVFGKDDTYDFDTTLEDINNDDEILTNRQKRLKLEIEKLGKKCKEVLELFYYRGYTIEDITNYLEYDNKNVVKSQKSRCLKQLKDKINAQ